MTGAGSGDSQLQGLDEVDGVKRRAGSRQTVKHAERNNNLLVTRTMWLDKRQFSDQK